MSNYGSMSGGMTIQEVADELGISRTRVRQIEASALSKLRYQIMKNCPELKNYFKDYKLTHSNYDDGIYC